MKNILIFGFLLMFLFPLGFVSAEAVIITMTGNNESAFGVTGTFDDSNYQYGIGAGTPFTAA